MEKVPPSNHGAFCLGATFHVVFWCNWSYNRFWVLALLLKTLVESVVQHRFLYLVVCHYSS
jgi:hypothetical protein